MTDAVTAKMVMTTDLFIFNFKLASRWKSGSMWNREIYPFCDFKVKMRVALAAISCIITVRQVDENNTLY